MKMLAERGVGKEEKDLWFKFCFVHTIQNGEGTQVDCTFERGAKIYRGIYHIPALWNRCTGV